MTKCLFLFAFLVASQLKSSEPSSVYANLFSSIRENDVGKFLEISKIYRIDEQYFVNLFEESPVTAIIKSDNLLLLFLALQFNYDFKKKNRYGQTPIICMVQRKPGIAYSMLELLFQYKNKKELLDDEIYKRETALDTFQKNAWKYELVDRDAIQVEMHLIANKPQFNKLNEIESELNGYLETRTKLKNKLNFLSKPNLSEFSIYRNLRDCEIIKLSDCEIIKEREAALSEVEGLNPRISFLQARANFWRRQCKEDLDKLTNLSNLEYDISKLESIKNMLKS